jgi:hypothetical protein
MRALHFIWLYLWIVPHALLIVVVIAMFRRRLHKQFPIFFSYLAFEFLRFCILFAIYRHGGPSWLYARIDILCRTGDVALRFGVLQELFDSPLLYDGRLPRNIARLRNGVTALVVIFAAIFVGLFCYRIIDHWTVPSYVVVEAMNASQCGLLILVFLWHRFLGHRMSPFPFGMAVGLGLLVGVEPFVWALAALSPQYWVAADFVNMGTYHLVVVLWLYSAYAREKAPSEVQIAPLPQLQEWVVDLEKTTRI